MIDRIIVLLGGLRSEDLDQVSPVQRQQFANPKFPCRAAVLGG